MPHWPGPTIVIPDLNERTHWLGNRDAAVWVSSCLSFVLHFNQWTSKLFSWYSLEYSGRLSYLILFSVSRSNSSRSQERLEKQTHLLRYTYVRRALISDYNLSHPKARHYLHRSQFPLISAHSTVTPSICFCFAGFFFGTVFCQPVSWYLPCFIIIFGCAGICCCSLLLSTDYLLYCLNFNAHRSVCDAVCFLINALYWFVCVCDNLKCTAALQAVKRRKKSMPFRHFRIISAIWMRRQ